MDKEKHDWMGWDRYNKAKEILEKENPDFDVDDCFNLLKEVSQTVCPTTVSMVYDATENKVYCFRMCASERDIKNRVKRFCIRRL